MHLALLLLIQLGTVLIPHPLYWAFSLVAGLSLVLSAREHWSKKGLVLAAGLFLLPFFLLLTGRRTVVEEPAPPRETFTDDARLDRYFDETSMARALAIFSSRNPRMGNEDAAGLLDHVELEPHVSVSLLNLNYEPIVWKGLYFSDQYKNTRLNAPKLLLQDGRLFCVVLYPLPSTTRTQGFVAVEILFLSKNMEERRDTWLYRVNPAYLYHRPVVVEPRFSSFLREQAELIGITPPPFDISFVRDTRQPLYLDLVALIWSLFVLTAVFLIHRGLGFTRSWPIFLVYLALLAFPETSRLDYLTTFASYIFGNKLWGNLLSSPFHFFISAGLIFLLIQGVSTRLFKRFPFSGVILFALLALLVALAPGFLQKYNSFSYVHPLEAFSSPGAFLSYISLLSVFVYPLLLLETIAPLSVSWKLGATLPLAVLVFWISPATVLAPVSLGLVWLLKDFKTPHFLRAGLAVLMFYPFLVRKEQVREIEFVRDELLDEITLLVERNHLRMGRIIRGLAHLRTQIEEATHEYLMQMFAEDSGLFEDEIDFSLRLAGPNGQIISQVEQHLSLDRIPYELGPRGRIEIFPDARSDPNWLVFRQILEAESGDFGFVAVLGNDFRNLSLVRRLRNIDGSGSLRGSKGPSPYHAYALDVFDLEGMPLYSQGSATPLSRQERERMATAPYFWYVRGRNTTFFFQDRFYIYRIVHQATPPRMIFVRYLSLFLALMVLLQSVRLIQRPGHGLLSRWRRSFAMKLAGFMFLSSVLPTSTLGFFLINSIQRNQSREEASIARSKILAAKNLFRELNQSREARSREGGQINRVAAPRFAISPRDWPIQNFSSILGEDLSLFSTGTLIRTNQPEVFRTGVLNRRLPYDLARELYLVNTSYMLERKPLPSGASLLVAYSPIRLGPNRQGVLAMTMIPFSQRQNLRWREQLELSTTILFGLLFAMAMLTLFIAKNYLRPVAAITRGASRMAKGLSNRPIVLNRQDELQRMVRAFNTMQERILRSQSQLRQQLDILDKTLKAMSGGVLGFNQKGHIILGNDKAWELLQLKEKARDLKELTQLRTGLGPLSPLFEKGINGDLSFHLEETDERREMLAIFRMVEPQQTKGIRCILVVEDITDALAAGRFKAWSEMARRVAHEIKNPLTPIQLELDYLEKLYQDRHPEFGAALGDAACEIRQQVQRLRRIATEFSDYARPLEVQRHQVHITDLLCSLCAPYEKTLSGLKVHKELESDVIAHVDERLLRRAIHNLIANAVQAMEQEGTLGVRLLKGENELRIWIQDTGPGIPEEERHRVFDAYFSTKDQGTGLGLVIAKKYIDLHGGSLTIDSNYRGGTRFQVYLPLLPAEVEPDTGADG